MPWPPSIKDLHISKINIGLPLSFFVNALLSGHIGESESSRVIRLKLSIGQDLVYAISQGRIKTLKSILYPAVIKSRTNCTALLTLNNKLGHGVSYSILEELFTENAFYTIDQQVNEDIFIPCGFAENKLTIAVYDNIDRLEETLTGKKIIYKKIGKYIFCVMLNN